MSNTNQSSTALAGSVTEKLHVHFDEKHVLHELRHYLPTQTPLKDFIHHNSMHALAQEVSFLNKAAIKQTLAHLPENSKVVINAGDTVYIDYDVLELIRDFLNFGSKDKNIQVQLKNFKKEYKMEDSVHVHSEKDPYAPKQNLLVPQNN